MIHPALQKFPATFTDVADLVEQSFLRVDECLWLAKSWHIQVSENISQMLLRHCRADRADRRAQHAWGLARPRALPIRARGVIDRVLENARDRAVVFCGDQ